MTPPVGAPLALPAPHPVGLTSWCQSTVVCPACHNFLALAVCLRPPELNDEEPEEEFLIPDADHHGDHHGKDQPKGKGRPSLWPNQPKAMPRPEPRRRSRSRRDDSRPEREARSSASAHQPRRASEEPRRPNVRDFEGRGRIRRAAWRELFGAITRSQLQGDLRS